jgi:hypothetical protein
MLPMLLMLLMLLMLPILLMLLILLMLPMLLIYIHKNTRKILSFKSLSLHNMKL